MAQQLQRMAGQANAPTQAPVKTTPTTNAAPAFRKATSVHLIDCNMFLTSEQVGDSPKGATVTRVLGVEVAVTDGVLKVRTAAGLAQAPMTFSYYGAYLIRE